MLSLQPFPCRGASTFLHSSSDNPPFFLVNNKIHPPIFLVFATTIKENLDPYSHSSIKKFQFQHSLEKFAQKPEDEEKFQSSEKLQTISELNHMLVSLITAEEFELAIKLKDYSILVNFHCKKNEPMEAKIVVDHMLENGFVPNVATFTTLINSFSQSGKMRDAFEVFDVMSSIGCEPTINTYNCLLKGLCYVGRVEEAYDLLMNIKKSSIKPDIYTYTAVMDGFCKVGRSNEAFELLIEAQNMLLIPNVVTYNTLFHSYFKEGKPLRGFGLLRRMKESNCSPDYISYSTFLHGLLKWGKVKAALQIYNEMVGIGLQVDERMMNTLLRHLCRHSRKEEEFLKDVYHLFEVMKNGNFTIYSCAYDLVVEALINGKKTDKAFVVLNEMVKIGFSPKTFTFNIVIHGLCLESEVDKALGVLMLMHKDRKPVGIPFGFLIHELNRRGRSLDACHVYGIALKRGVVPKRKPVKYLVKERLR